MNWKRISCTSHAQVHVFDWPISTLDVRCIPSFSGVFSAERAIKSTPYIGETYAGLTHRGEIWTVNHPPYSLDLNPIEHMWWALKIMVGVFHSDLDTIGEPQED